MKCYAIRLQRPGSDAPEDEVIASVKARDLTEAIAVAMRRYPGALAVDGDLQATLPPSDDASATGS